MKVLKALLTALTVLAVGLTGALLFLHDKNAPRYVQDLHEYRRAVSLPHQKRHRPSHRLPRERGVFFVSRWYFRFTKAGRNPFRHFALRNTTAPFCRLAATSSPGRGKSFHSGGGFGKGVKFMGLSVDFFCH